LQGRPRHKRRSQLANGLHPGLAQSLGIERRVVSRGHTMAIGFDLHPVGRSSFDFKALTCYPEKASDGVAYMSIFAAGGTTRVNMFTYWNAREGRLNRLRDDPEKTLLGLWPKLDRVTGAFVAENVRIRPIDLYVTEGYRQPGIVLVGDAFATACPAVGVGANKVLTDVERLCNVTFLVGSRRRGWALRSWRAFTPIGSSGHAMRAQPPGHSTFARFLPMRGWPGARGAGRVLASR